MLQSSSPKYYFMFLLIKYYQIHIYQSIHFLIVLIFLYLILSYIISNYMRSSKLKQTFKSPSALTLKTQTTARQAYFQHPKNNQSNKNQVSADRKLYHQKAESLKNQYTRKLMYENQSLVNQNNNLRNKCASLQEQNRQLNDEILNLKRKMSSKATSSSISSERIEKNRKNIQGQNLVSQADSCVGNLLMVMQQQMLNEDNLQNKRKVTRIMSVKRSIGEQKFLGENFERQYMEQRYKVSLLQEEMKRLNFELNKYINQQQIIKNNLKIQKQQWLEQIKILRNQNDTLKNQILKSHKKYQFQLQKLKKLHNLLISPLF